MSQQWRNKVLIYLVKNGCDYTHLSTVRSCEGCPISKECREDWQNKKLSVQDLAKQKVREILG